jgi:3',5'-nucleoside bisphosphate phosphatase
MDNKPNFLCDLHCHTSRSDGKDGLVEFIHNAVKQGMEIVAVTDHDIVLADFISIDGREIECTDYAKKLGLKLIPGIEISCDTDVEDVHMLGYGCNWSDLYFSNLDKFIKKSKIESYMKLIAALQKRGFYITLEDVLETGGGKGEPEKIQKKHIFETLARKGYVSTWQEAKIMTQKDEAFKIKREKPNPADVIKEIHRSGGIAVLAHPYLIDDEVFVKGEKITRKEYIDYLIKEGLDGIEGDYTYDKTSYKGNMSKKEIFKEVLRMYEDKVRVITGGSDYHGDGKNGMNNPRFIGECGITKEYFFRNELLKNL